MKPTEKNKEQFEKWYYTFEEELTISEFYELPLEMQLGVYLSYYDNKGYRVNVQNFKGEYKYFRFKINGSFKYYKEALKTLQEAYKEAYKEANELINKSLEE